MAARLKNYTTSVPASRSISEIEQLLLDFGAVNFMKKADPETRQFSAIMFSLDVGGKEIAFRLPANTDKVAEYLYREYMSHGIRHKKTREDFRKDAYNITWRIIKDWTHAQVSIITTEMMRIEEVFLPYVITGDDQTLAEKFSAGKLDRMLPAYTP